MSRTVRDAKLETREARSRLKARGKPYWKVLVPGKASVHQGYRRLAGKPGTWCRRYYDGSKHYTTETHKGVADDREDADGVNVLSFEQAQRWALGKRAKAGPYTIGEAVCDYLQHIEHKPSHYDASLHARVHILPELGTVKVEELTPSRLSKWLQDISRQGARKRVPKGEPQKFHELDNTAEGRRRRQASANRIWTTLKACLNHAWREGHAASDAAWRRVKAFKGATAARIDFLTIAEAGRLVNVCDTRFQPLVQGALATGCRYSELARLVASDFNRDAGGLHIRTSKSGKPRFVTLNAEGVALFDRLCAGRGADELLFRLPSGRPWSRGCQTTPMRQACKDARIKPVGFHALRHTWASLSVMAGMPIAVVARNLGHASTKMVETHYGHLRPDFVAEQIKQHAPTFGFKIDTKVAALR
jgi:integrase